MEIRKLCVIINFYNSWFINLFIFYFVFYVLYKIVKEKTFSKFEFV